MSLGSRKPGKNVATTVVTVPNGATVPTVATGVAEIGSLVATGIRRARLARLARLVSLVSLVWRQRVLTATTLGSRSAFAAPQPA